MIVLVSLGDVFCCGGLYWALRVSHFSSSDPCVRRVLVLVFFLWLRLSCCGPLCSGYPCLVVLSWGPVDCGFASCSYHCLSPKIFNV